MSASSSPRVALVPSEALRPTMAGIGVRYLELARRLPSAGLDVVLLTPGDPADVPATGLPDGAVRRFERGALAQLASDCDVVVTQGQLANDVVVELGDRPIAIDLYDPFLVENVAYLESLGLDPWRNDHATWIHQMAHGDFFLCSCEEQRLYYLGFLTALGRVNPHRLRDDPDARELIDVVPFGVDPVLPPHQPLLPSREPGECRLLFGGLYDWYDPWPVLEALAARRERPWTLLVVRNPNAGTPQSLFARVERWARERRLWHADGTTVPTGARVQVIEWVEASRRFDLLRDVDLVVATHQPSLETSLSLRTRFLESLAAGLPVVATEGGGIARMLRAHEAGWVVPPGDAEAVGRALDQALASIDPSSTNSSSTGLASTVARATSRRHEGARALLAAHAWDRALAPLVDFCHARRRDTTRTDFAFRPSTATPADSLSFRARRRLRRLLRRDSAGGAA